MIAFCVLIACSKNNKGTDQSNTKIESRSSASFQRAASLGSTPMVYRDENGEFIPFSFDELQHFYINSQMLSTQNNRLLSSTLINFVDENGNKIPGIRTKWESTTAEKFTTITSRITLTNINGEPTYVLGDSKTMGMTYTCTCEGSCSNGCDASTNGSSYCSCSACFPSGTCIKKNSIIYTTSASFNNYNRTLHTINH